MKKPFASIAAALTVAGLILVESASPAAALDKPIGATIAIHGAAVWHDKIHYHRAANNISFRLVSNSNWCGGPLNFGLRKANTNTQYTKSISFMAPSSGFATSVRSGTSAVTTMPIGNYSVISREPSGACGYQATTTWKGTLRI